MSVRASRAPDDVRDVGCSRDIDAWLAADPS